MGRHAVHEMQPTSRAAFNDRKASGAVSEMERRIFAHIRDSGPHGATADEVRRAFKLRDPNSVSPRVSWLAKQGRIVLLGQTRLTLAGHAAGIYVTPEHAAPGPLRTYRIWVAKRGTGRGSVDVQGTGLDDAWDRIASAAVARGFQREDVTNIELLEEKQVALL